MFSWKTLPNLIIEQSKHKSCLKRSAFNFSSTIAFAELIYLGSTLNLCWQTCVASHGKMAASKGATATKPATQFEPKDDDLSHRIVLNSDVPLFVHIRPICSRSAQTSNAGAEFDRNLQRGQIPLSDSHGINKRSYIQMWQSDSSLAEEETSAISRHWQGNVTLQYKQRSGTQLSKTKSNIQYSYQPRLRAIGQNQNNIFVLTFSESHVSLEFLMLKETHKQIKHNAKLPLAGHSLQNAAD